MTSNDLLQLKIHADEMQLYLVRESNIIFPLVFHMVGGVLKFDIRLVIYTEHVTNGHVGSDRCTDTLIL
jgi:hypothetical protein